MVTAVSGYIALNENALAVMRWQPVQWQAKVIRGAPRTVSRNCPQRQALGVIWVSVMSFPSASGQFKKHIFQPRLLDRDVADGHLAAPQRVDDPVGLHL